MRCEPSRRCSSSRRCWAVGCLRGKATFECPAALRHWTGCRGRASRGCCPAGTVLYDTVDYNGSDWVLTIASCSPAGVGRRFRIPRLGLDR
jgi:hypothetical protein